MCGRFTLQTPAETLQRMFGFAAPGPSWDPARTDRPRYNIAPTQPILVARATAAGRRGLWASWGITAAKNRLAINARSETVFERPAFREPVRHGRVLVFADGFIEWKKVAGARLPYHVTRSDGATLVLAGVLAESGPGPRGTPCPGAAILTMAANDDVRPLHDRMPVVLSGEAIDRWLDPALEHRSEIAPLLAPAPPGVLRLRAISTRVNKVDHDDPACLADAEAPAPSPEAGGAQLEMPRGPSEAGGAELEPNRAAPSASGGAERGSGRSKKRRRGAPDPRQLGFDFG